MTLYLASTAAVLAGLALRIARGRASAARPLRPEVAQPS